MKPHRGTLILVFGILGIVSCLPLGIAAWVMGKRDLKEMDAGTMDPGGRGNTSAGRICGMIGTLLAAAGLLLFLVWIIIRLFLSLSPDRKTLEPARPSMPVKEAPVATDALAPAPTNPNPEDKSHQ